MKGSYRAPRPNVATGATVGYVVVVLSLLLAALESNPTTLEEWLFALTPLAGAIAAYVGPKYEKAFHAAIGGGLWALVLVVVSIAQGTAVFDKVFVLTLVVAVAQAVATALVSESTAD